MSHIKYRPDIDGLRAVAVLAVVAFHAFPERIQGGFVGVDVFFVISGYLISSILFRDFEQGTFAYRNFYKKRVLRIFPALFLVLTSCLVFGWHFLFANELGQLGKHVAAGVGFISNFVLWSEAGYFDNLADTKPLLHLWSLGVEEQFYVFWPLFLGAFRKRRDALLPLVVGVACLSFAASVYVVGQDTVGAFYSPVTRLWEIMLGSILAYLNVRGPGTPRKTAGLQAALGLLLIVVALVVTNKGSRFPGWWALLPAAGAFFLISAGPEAWLNRVVIGNPLFVQVGLISYPLYLWHWPLFSFAYILHDGPPPALVSWSLILLSFVLAWLTYRFVETPVRTHPRGGKVAVALGVLMLCVGLGGFAIHGSGGGPSRTIESASAVLDVHKKSDQAIRARYRIRACEGALSAPEDVAPFCTTYNTKATGELVFIWGDSHAEAWAPLFYQLAREHDLRVVMVSHRGCPPLVGVRRSDGVDTGEDCTTAARADSVVRYVAHLKPSVVVLVGFWSLYAHGWSIKGVLQSSTHFLTTSETGDATPETSQAALVSQIPATIDGLLGTGTKVAVFKSPPHLKRNLSKRNFLRRADIEVSRAEHDDFERFTARVIERQREEKGVVVFDPAPFLCTDTCQSVVRDIPMYSDDNHVTEQAALMFKDDVERLLMPLIQPK